MLLVFFTIYHGKLLLLWPFKIWPQSQAFPSNPSEFCSYRAPFVDLCCNAFLRIFILSSHKNTFCHDAQEKITSYHVLLSFLLTFYYIYWNLLDVLLTFYYAFRNFDLLVFSEIYYEKKLYLLLRPLFRTHYTSPTFTLKTQAVRARAKAQ